jgi:hypothetical protein
LGSPFDLNWWLVQSLISDFYGPGRVVVCAYAIRSSAIAEHWKALHITYECNQQNISARRKSVRKTASSECGAGGPKPGFGNDSVIVNPQPPGLIGMKRQYEFEGNSEDEDVGVCRTGHEISVALGHWYCRVARHVEEVDCDQSAHRPV